MRWYVADHCKVVDQGDGTFGHYVEVDPKHRRVLPLRVYLPAGKSIIESTLFASVCAERDNAIEELEAALRRENEVLYQLGTLPTNVIYLRGEVTFLEEQVVRLEKECEQRVQEAGIFYAAFRNLRSEVLNLLDAKDPREFRKSLHCALREVLTEQGYLCREELPFWHWRRWFWSKDTLPTGFFGSFNSLPNRDFRVRIETWQALQQELRLILGPLAVVPDIPAAEETEGGPESP